MTPLLVPRAQAQRPDWRRLAAVQRGKLLVQLSASGFRPGQSSWSWTRHRMLRAAPTSTTSAASRAASLLSVFGVSAEAAALQALRPEDVASA